MMLRDTNKQFFGPMDIIQRTQKCQEVDEIFDTFQKFSLKRYKKLLARKEIAFFLQTFLKECEQSNLSNDERIA